MSLNTHIGCGPNLDQLVCLWTYILSAVLTSLHWDITVMYRLHMVQSLLRWKVVVMHQLCNVSDLLQWYVIAMYPVGTVQTLPKGHARVT